jgi:hypothetical protein
MGSDDIVVDYGSIYRKKTDSLDFNPTLTKNNFASREAKERNQREKEESRTASRTIGWRIILPEPLPNLRRIHRLQRRSSGGSSGGRSSACATRKKTRADNFAKKTNKILNHHAVRAGGLN